MRALLISLLFGGALLVPLVGTADPTGPVPPDQRMSGIDGNVYEDPGLGMPPVTRKFRLIVKSKSSSVTEGKATEGEGEGAIEVLSFDPRVVKSRVSWSNKHGSYAQVRHLALSGMLQLKEKDDEPDAKPSIWKIVSAEGRLWPLKEGAKITVVYENKYEWSDTWNLNTSEFKVTGRYPASFVHSNLTGDVYRITERTNHRQKGAERLSGEGVNNYALIEDVGYAVTLDHQYKGISVDYETKSSYEITDFRFLD